jgi:undecaprenyl pyrophosphate synthase
MIIGADELIYRIRKNGGAKNIDNMRLGRRIVDLIIRLSGQKKISDHPSYWDISPNALKVSDFELPQTSEQYLITPAILPDIYQEIDQW